MRSIPIRTALLVLASASALVAAAPGCSAASTSPDRGAGGAGGAGEGTDPGAGEELPVADPDGPEPTGDTEPSVFPGTVGDAVTSTCATANVEGLSLQIIREGRCLAPDAYAEVPVLANVTFASGTFRYLETPARDALVAAANASPGASMKVTSMLRTIAQQYLVWRWYQMGTCGIGLAAKPGNSNHETGLAFDTPDQASWRTALSARGFHWYGSADPVHFDYTGAGAKSWKGLDVKAFQALWNRNHPEDAIAVDGIWGPQTEARLRQSPAKGFASGPACDAADAGAEAGADGGVDAGLDGAISAWSCTGSYGTHPMADGQYYATAFGCWTDSNGSAHQDPGDNCIPACLSQAQASGLCAGLSGPACEQSVGWYAADGARFGCLARLKVTNPANGKAAVVVALDYGPSCTVEKSVSHAIVDLSTPANLYLFGSQQGAVDRALVRVDVVDPATPLGPVP